ncbi:MULTISPECIES: carbohydrate ABC transporter permease [Paenibacillus]|uniref:carbohydrate ABC transporter permease n=1 Tax=Paenibacillus TaxID=44249 RepID=UPI001C1FA41C|nr:carbohydrate ABC transporter permease [Paenibacillus oleatilyticus]MBU7316597.1 carbohydrate ABC transporter permease [Paenibacillus oleatilyticus]GMX67433.1 carbohydrate ABC transporter permease [Paenibacillus elgii]
MMRHASVTRRLFDIGNTIFLIALSLLCILPIIQVVAVSFSSSSAAAAGLVKLWPVDFSLKSYEFILKKKDFLGSFLISIERVILGTGISMFLTVTLGYALSKEVKDFRMRTFYAWYFVITILFSGGLIPWYLTIKYTNLLDTIWALVIPGAVTVFNVILVLNFFRGLPKELEESCFIDGGSHWTTLWKIYLPLSLPAIATITLFTIVNHWNSWFDGLMLMNSPSHYPLATYLQTAIIQHDFANMRAEDVKTLAEISDRTTRAAQIFIGALPIMAVYPFLQKYFMTGLVMGSVKE